MVFEQEYNNIKNSITYSNDGMCLLDKETVKLLALLCTDGNGKHQKVLIPNLSGGELALCADEWEGYTLLEKVRQVLQDKILNTNNQLILEDFLKADIETKYKSIILFPPMGVRIGLKRIEEAYIDKCLNLLDEGGRLIVLVPQNVTNSMAFTDLRERILRGYSLEAVIMVKRKETAMNTNIGLCALVIEAKNQTQNIYMSLGGQDADDIFRGFKQGTDGFYVDASEVYDRFDVSFYEPQYKEVRNLIQKRDTVKLGDLAIVFPGIMIPSEERKAFGDYLIIKPQNICDREVHLDNQKKVYCLKEFINSGRRATNCVLRNGDILVSIAGKIDWAIYTGADNVAVAHQSVAVIRGIEGKEDWLRLFFSTNTGIEHFESQLKFFSHCGVVNHISIGELSAIAVPDTKLMTMADNVRKGIDIEAKVSALFRDLGWDVREEYRKDGFAYDLSLFYNNELRGVVEVKTYESQKIRNNRMIARQLEQYKRNLNNVGLYLFIDNTTRENLSS